MYSNQFFKNRQSTAGASADVIVPWLVQIAHPRSVFDVGCGTGSWLARFQQLGVNDVRGVGDLRVQGNQLELTPELFSLIDLTALATNRHEFDLATWIGNS